MWKNILKLFNLIEVEYKIEFDGKTVVETEVFNKDVSDKEIEYMFQAFLRQKYSIHKLYYTQTEESWRKL